MRKVVLGALVAWVTLTSVACERSCPETIDCGLHPRHPLQRTGISARKSDGGRYYEYAHQYPARSEWRCKVELRCVTQSNTDE